MAAEPLLPPIESSLMRTPPQSETEYWDRVIEFAATANEATTAEDVHTIMDLGGEAMAESDKKAPTHSKSDSQIRTGR